MLTPKLVGITIKTYTCYCTLILTECPFQCLFPDLTPRLVRQKEYLYYLYLLNQFANVFKLYTMYNPDYGTNFSLFIFRYLFVPFLTESSCVSKCIFFWGSANLLWCLMPLSTILYNVVILWQLYTVSYKNRS